MTFAHPSPKRAAIADIDGKPIYVLKVAPKNQPMYFRTDEPPPAQYRRIGRRKVALAFALPKTFQTSRNAGLDSLPVHARWGFAIDRFKDDLRKQPPPYHSRRFPEWKLVDPRVLRSIDAIVAAFAETKPGGERALRKALRALDRYEEHIDTVAAEELSEALVTIAVRAGMVQKVAEERHMVGVTPEVALEFWKRLAKGDLGWLEKQPWKPGYGR